VRARQRLSQPQNPAQTRRDRRTEEKKLKGFGLRRNCTFDLNRPPAHLTKLAPPSLFDTTKKRSNPYCHVPNPAARIAGESVKGKQKIWPFFVQTDLLRDLGRGVNKASFRKSQDLGKNQ
jgi:hypothetical protein